MKDIAFGFAIVIIIASSIVTAVANHARAAKIDALEEKIDNIILSRETSDSAARSQYDRCEAMATACLGKIGSFK